MKPATGFTIHTDAGYHETCPCGELSDCIWDSDDSQPVALCAACYVARAKKTVDRLLAENHDDGHEMKARLYILSNRNRSRAHCTDCGADVPRHRGHRAWVVVDMNPVVVCQACTDERMQELHDTRKLF